LGVSVRCVAGLESIFCRQARQQNNLTVRVIYLSDNHDSGNNLTYNVLLFGG